MFDGVTYDPVRDGPRLRRQMDRVLETLAGGEWWTLRDLARVANGSEAAVSARLRDLRKPQFGGHQVDRRYRGGGVWQYRLVPPGRLF